MGAEWGKNGGRMERMGRELSRDRSRDTWRKYGREGG